MVSQTGHVRTHSNGFFEVSAVMLRNHHNRQSAKFIILPPSRLEIVEFVMEAEVGSPVILHIALYAEREKDGATIQLPFTKCQELPFHIKQSDVKFRHNKTMVVSPIGISCGNIAMTALDVGMSKVSNNIALITINIITFYLIYFTSFFSEHYHQFLLRKYIHIYK